MKRLSSALLLLLVLSLPLAAQDVGTVRGRVTDEAGRPLAEALVDADGRGGVFTDAEGHYVLQLPPGEARIRARHVTHAPAGRAVRIRERGEVEERFALTPRTLIYDDARHFDVGIDTMRPDKPTIGAAAYADSFAVDERTSAETFSELLAGRVPGLVVQRFSGSAGAASRLELRGPSAVGFRREPLLVIDGQRVISEEQSLTSNPGGGASLSSYDDLDPDLVESVTVLPGPAAAARYGPAAANGVIEVRTRGHSYGRPRWRAFAEAGLREDAGGYPANYAQVGRAFDGERIGNCDLLFQSAGVCTPLADSLRAFNPLERSSPLRTGSRQGAGVSVSGGSDLVAYSAGFGYRRTLGVLDENDDRLANARASVALFPLPSFNVRVSAAHLRREATPVLEGPTLLSVLTAGLLGSADSTENGGYNPAFRRDADVWDGSHASRRTRAGAEASWLPFGWLRVGARYAIDRATHDEDTRTQAGPSASGDFTSEADRTRELRDAGAEAVLRLRPFGRWDARTTLGFERVSERSRFFVREESPSGAFGERETRNRRAVTGLSLRQVLVAGPLAVEAGVRRDEVRDLDGELWSGSAGAAWTVGAAAPWLDGIRLRAAGGRSERTPESVPGVDLPDLLAVPCPAIEVCDLEPQTSTELEAGFDARLLGRLELAVTGYRRDDADVFFVEGNVARVRAGTDVRNTGVEVALRAPVLARPGVAWEVEVLGWANRNRVTARPEGAVPVIGPNAGRITEGRPLGAWFDRPLLGYGDADGNGIIGRHGCPDGPTCEVELGDTAAYLGSPIPTRMVALASRVRLAERVTVSARLEHQGGAKLFNRIGQFRCASFRNCRETVDATAPLADQARAAAAQLGSIAGYVEDADFVKLREVAVTVSAPEGWARRIGAAGVDLTVAGRNLVTWTDYTGLDPEISTVPGSPFERVDFGSQPLARTVTTRVELRF